MVRWAGLALLFCLAPLVQAAFGQSYPERPIRIISPNPAGGSNDTIVRIVAAKMSTILDTPIIIDNRGGAGGKIGAEAVAHATPDGYTLLAGSVSTHSFAPVVTAKLNYDPIKDFEPISLIALVQNLLVVNPKLPATTVQELIALAKSQPGKLNYASGGPGSTSHFAVAMFIALAGIQNDTVHVPFRGGGPGDDGDHCRRHPILLQSDRRHGAVRRGRIGPAACGERRHAIAGAAASPDHRRGRDATLQGGRLVRLDGAGWHARQYRLEAERCGG